MKWQHFKAAFHRVEHKFVIRATGYGHAVYYTLVSIEAHGGYRYAAMFLLVMMAFELFTKGEVSHA